MSEGAVTLAGESELRLSGVLDYQTGPRLRKEGRPGADQIQQGVVAGDRLLGGKEVQQRRFVVAAVFYP